MNRDGSKPRAVTKETFRLLNSRRGRPTASTSWRASTSPPSAPSAPARCGSTTAAAATACSSPRSANDQKDTGEPVFSPDGRYLYFSQDITPGRDLRVQQGPERRDLRHPASRPARRARSSASSPARAARPADAVAGRQDRSPSSAACASRACSTSWTCAPARRWPIYDGLDRDMQETWAIHGRLPRHGLDAGLEVASSSGPAARSGASTRRASKVAEIPFHVRDHAARRSRRCASRVEVAPKTFATRDAALGRRLAEGRPGGLPGPGPPLDPQSAGRQAAAPDAAERPLRVLPLVLARRPLRSSTPPGTTTSSARCGWSRPTAAKAGPWSPTPGPLRRAGLHARRQADRLPQDRGRLPAHPRLVARAGRLPRRRSRVAASRSWSPRTAGSRTSAPRATACTCCVSIGEGKRQLVSIGLDGKRGAAAPDERERHRVPALAGRPLGGLHGALPGLRDAVRRHRQGGGRRPQGERAAAAPGDARRRRVPALVRRLASGSTGRSVPSSTRCELKNAFTFLDGAPEKLPDPPATGIDIGFQAESDVPKGTVALVGGARHHHARRRGDRGRHGGDRGQPHHGRGSAREHVGPDGRLRGRRQGQDGHPRPDRRPLARRDSARTASCRRATG